MNYKQSQLIVHWVPCCVPCGHILPLGIRALILQNSHLWGGETQISQVHCQE